MRQVLALSKITFVIITITKFYFMNFPFILKNSMAEMRNLSLGEIADLQNDVYKGVYLLGYYTEGDTPDPVIYYKSSTNAPDDGGSVVIPSAGGIKLEHRFKDEIDIRYFGVIGDGMTNETNPVKSYFEYVNLNNLFWVIPGRFKILINESFDIKTSGRCDGKFLLQKGNDDVTINIVRSHTGENVDISNWDINKAVRGSLDVGFVNDGIANLLFDSNEILIERIGAGPYYKKEFVRTNEGKLTTPLVCSYTDKTQLTVTKFHIEEPIIIDNLIIEVQGSLVNGSKYLLIKRDNVTLNNPKIINETNNTGSVAMEIDKCADVIINSPFIKGFTNAGNGYGIANYESIGVTINEGNVIDCRHGYTGRNSVDVTINRGVWEDGIDDHWTDRFTANHPIIKTDLGGAGFQFAGNDITLNSPIVNGAARIFFGIRMDTPSLGGIINIHNPVFNSSEIDDVYLFAYTTPGGKENPSELPNYTNKPTLPKSLNIINPVINTRAKEIYCFYLGVFSHSYTNLERLKITDPVVNVVDPSPTTAYISALFIKDSIYQEVYQTEIEITGRLMTNVANTLSAYITSRYKDEYNGRIDLVLNNSFGYKTVRFSGDNVKNVIMHGGEINNFDIDDPNSSFDTCNIQFKDVEFNGGAIYPGLSHALFQNCIFKGDYTVFPPANQVSLVNNLKYNISGLPANIVNNIVAPFQ